MNSISPIVIELARIPGGSVASCTVAGRGFVEQSSGATTVKLCRAMLDAGVPDAPWRVVERGKPVMFGRSIHRMGATIDGATLINETPSGDPYSPRVMRIAAAMRAERKAAAGA